MKKFLSILMAAAMLLSVCALTACGGSEEPAPTDDTAESDAVFTTVNPGKLTMSTNAEFPP